MTVGAGSVPFVDLQAQIRTIESDVMEAISGVVASGAFILGPELQLFEQEYAEYCGVPYAVGVDSGLSAIELSLRALDLRPGDEVITQANTYVATVSAIREAGGRAVIVDCDERGGIDVGAMEAAMTDRTRAIVPVHMYGRICDIDAVSQVAGRSEVTVIEDACQAHGAVVDGRRAGAFGDVGAFSFYPGKNLGAFGDGGMIVGRSGRIPDWVRQVRNYGQVEKYDHRQLPLNRRLDPLQAAVLRVKLRHLDAWNRKRELLADAYRERLVDQPVAVPPEEAPGRHVYHLFQIELDNRDALRSALLAQGIETGIHYPTPVHRLSAFSDLGYQEGAFPRAEAHAKRTLSLPMYPEMPMAAIDLVTEAIERFFTG
jgi:dTDP-4-amino-4,6-dideoxygalactose transaminase